MEGHRPGGCEGAPSDLGLRVGGDGWTTDGGGRAALAAFDLEIVR